MHGMPDTHAVRCGAAIVMWPAQLKSTAENIPDLVDTLGQSQDREYFVTHGQSRYVPMISFLGIGPGFLRYYAGPSN